MSSAKEKAKRLVDKMKEYCFHNFDNDAEKQQIDNAKQCALIAIDEISIQVYRIQESQEITLYGTLKYLEEVKTEIHKL